MASNRHTAQGCEGRPQSRGVAQGSAVHGPKDGNTHVGRVYYRAIEESTERGDSAPFIQFMLERILAACRAGTPQVRRLRAVLQGEAGREALMRRLGLRDAKHFRRRYLLPAMEAGWVEMTLPEYPRSPAQKYRLTPAGRRWAASSVSARPF